MIQINLLPWREKVRKQQKIHFLFHIALFACLGLFCIAIIHIYYSSKIYSQLQRNQILQATLDKETDDLTSLDQQRKELTEINDELHFIYSLRTSSYLAIRLLNELAAAIPDTVILYKIIRTENTILVFGKAKSNLQVTLFMENINKYKFLKQPVLTEISGKENEAGEERIFQLKLEQQE